jgi:chitinase
VAGHQANLFSEDSNAFSTSKAVKHYRKHIASEKLVIGLPLYGRSFANTDGPGQPFQGLGPGSWEKGVYDYKALPLPGSEVKQDFKLGASWCYSAQSREMVSYDTVEMATHKANWIASEKVRLRQSELAILKELSWAAPCTGSPVVTTHPTILGPSLPR